MKDGNKWNQILKEKGFLNSSRKEKLTDSSNSFAAVAGFSRSPPALERIAGAGNRRGRRKRGGGEKSRESKSPGLRTLYSICLTGFGSKKTRIRFWLKWKTHWFRVLTRAGPVLMNKNAHGELPTSGPFRSDGPTFGKPDLSGHQVWKSCACTASSAAVFL